MKTWEQQLSSSIGILSFHLVAGCAVGGASGAVPTPDAGPHARTDAGAISITNSDAAPDAAPLEEELCFLPEPEGLEICGNGGDDDLDGRLEENCGPTAQDVYAKASNASDEDFFGWAIALSGDGATLVVGAPYEDSNATKANGDEGNDNAPDAGAAYVYARGSDGLWAKTAYLKASNAVAGDVFASAVAISGDGNVIAIGAWMQWSASSGINGNRWDLSAPYAGAVYIFDRDKNGLWRETNFIKPHNADYSDGFGMSLALSYDGSALVVGAPSEGSGAAGVDGDGTDNTLPGSGAAYVFTRDAGVWSETSYLKSSNPDLDDYFGSSVAISANGSMIVVGAPKEDGGATGINGAQGDNSALDSGAAYVFWKSRVHGWAQVAYLKAFNTETLDDFGHRVAISGDGKTVAVAADLEDSDASDVDGDSANNNVTDSGAVYTYTGCGTGWDEEAYIKSSRTSTTGIFGTDLALSDNGNVLAVSAHIDYLYKGAVYTYGRIAGAWTSIGRLEANVGSGGDGFGYSIGMSTDGGAIAVGAPWESSDSKTINGNPYNLTETYSGAAYVFE